MGNETKPCPLCAEEIAVTAKKCRFCNEWLEPVVKPVLWDGDKANVHKDTPLPLGRCWICGASEAAMKPKKKVFRYVPPGASFALGLIGQLLFQKTVTLELPLCGPCKTRWILTDVGLYSFVVLAVFLLPGVGGAIGHAVARDEGMVLGLIGGFVAWIAGALVIRYLVTPRYQISSTLVENDVVTLKLPNPANVRAALDEKRPG